MFFILTVILFVVYFLYKYLDNDEKTKEFNKISGPKILPFVGNAFDFLYKSKPVPIFYQLRSLANKYNGVYRMKFLSRKHVHIYNPHDIGMILSSRKHITKNGNYGFIRSWLKDGLLTSTGDKWQQRRKILTTAFHFNILQQFCKVFQEQSNSLVESLKQTKGEAVDIFPYINNFALNSICETSMGTNLDSTRDTVQQYKKAICALGEYIIYRSIRIWLYPKSTFKLSKIGIEQNKVVKTLHEFTKNVIKERRNERVLPGNKFVVEEMTDENVKNFKKRLAMLDLLLSAESEGTIDENGIREEVDTFMFEGHDTTTMSIVYCLMLLANNPEAQKLAYDEINLILDDSKKEISINDLNNMHYLERCVKESLRLYPSVHYIGRRIVEDLNMGSYVIPAGASVDIHIFDLHRDSKIYPNPLKFDPDRFLLENCINRHPYAYIPFSAGPRNCIGQRYAILEEKTVISLILKNFILEPVTKPDDISFTLHFVLRTKDPIKIKFIPRL